MTRLGSTVSRVAWTTGLVLACIELDSEVRPVAAGVSPGIAVGSRLEQRGSATMNAEQWVTSVIPQIAIGFSGPVTSWDLKALRSYDSYSTSPTPVPTTDLASLEGSGSPGEHSLLSMDANYLRTQDLFYLAPGVPLTSGVTQIASGTATGQLQRGEGDYFIRSVNRLDTGLADGVAQYWNAAVYPMRNETTRLIVRWSERDWWVDHAHALRTSAATAGWHRDHSPDLSTQLELGFADTRDDQHDTRSQDLAVSAEVVGSGRGVGIPLDVRARVTHDASTTGMAQLYREAPNTWVALRWERSLDAEGGLFTEPTIRNLFKLEVRDTIGGRTIASLDGSYGRTTNRVGDGIRVENRNASASLSRILQPWLTARAAYYYSRQIETQDATAQDSWRSRAELTVTAAIP